MKRLIIILFIVFISSGLAAQEEDRIVVYARVIDGDTLPIVPLKDVYIISYKVVKNKRQARKYSKLVRNVKKVYPYAKLAGIKYREYAEVLLNTPDKKERKKIMKQAEDELLEEYGDDLKKLTFSQGKILIKLVSRETGNSSYSVLQDFRGRFIAFWWQAFARIFGYNLKTDYDPEGEDREIELIVLMIENGQI
jgi:hypothetical protein